MIKDLACQLHFYESVFFLDDDEKCQREDASVIGNSQEAVRYKEDSEVVVAIGNPAIRRRLQEAYEAAGISMVTLIHPQAVLPEEPVEIGIGTVIMAGAVIQPGVKIGKGVIVNTSASIDHDCKLGDYVHLAVGAHLAGNVEVGDCTWIGAGATVSNNVHICSHVTVGAGAVVVFDITEPGTYVGVPVRKIKEGII